jgi:predicted DNA-binding transcriptional regulator YafY
MRNEALYRQWNIFNRIRECSNRGISKQQLAIEFEVSKKTIVRDIENLSATGCPIWSKIHIEDNNKLYYHLKGDFRKSDIRFSLSESYSLFTLMQVTSPLKSYFDETIDKCFDKIYLKSSDPFFAIAKKLTHLVLPDSSNVMKIEDNLHKMFKNTLEAIFSHKKIKFSYRSIYSKAIKHHTVSPLSIKFHKNNFYLAAYLKRKKTVLIFALNRIFDFEITEENQDHVNFDPHVFFDEAFGITQGETFQVKLQFDSSLKQFIEERTFHPNQEVKILKSGKTNVTFPAKSMQEVLGLVLSYQDKVKVLEPVELVEEVKVVLGKMVEKYAKN